MHQSAKVMQTSHDVKMKVTFPEIWYKSPMQLAQMRAEH